MLVKDVVDPVNPRQWNVVVNGNLWDWEIEEYENLLQTLANIHLSDQEDKLSWNHPKNGQFSVKSFYNLLASNSNQGLRLFPSNIIWKLGTTPRISFFSWEAAKGRILTLDNLMKRGVTTVNRCLLCKKSVESCNHLLLGCSISHNLWSTVLSLLSLSWVKNESIISELLAWEGISSKRKNFRLIPLTIFLDQLEREKQPCF